ncbi:hypothetical protein ACLKA6_011469 [Drosophila palustris]
MIGHSGSPLWRIAPLWPLLLQGARLARDVSELVMDVDMDYVPPATEYLPVGDASTELPGAVRGDDGYEYHWFMLATRISGRIVSAVD